LENVSVDGRDLNEQNVRIRTVFVWLGTEPVMGCCKQGDEPSASLRCGFIYLTAE
jgi:hypothetical protein